MAETLTSISLSSFFSSFAAAHLRTTIAPLKVGSLVVPLAHYHGPAVGLPPLGVDHLLDGDRLLIHNLHALHIQELPCPIRAGEVKDEGPSLRQLSGAVDAGDLLPSTLT